MILDDIVEKRKEQLQREKDNIEPQDRGLKEIWIIRDLRS